MLTVTSQQSHSVAVLDFGDGFSFVVFLRHFFIFLPCLPSCVEEAANGVLCPSSQCVGFAFFGHLMHTSGPWILKIQGDAWIGLEQELSSQEPFPVGGCWCLRCAYGLQGNIPGDVSSFWKSWTVFKLPAHPSTICCLGKKEVSLTLRRQFNPVYTKPAWSSECTI